jgi:hypothetical protein
MTFSVESTIATDTLAPRLSEVEESAAFYNYVQEALDSQIQRSGTEKVTTSKVTEKRSTERQNYQCTQLIASFDGQNLPSQSEFHAVLCHDLSPTGFSFWSPKKPNGIELIVALGKVPFIFMQATIVNLQKEASTSYCGWRVGCKFTNRVGA